MAQQLGTDTPTKLEVSADERGSKPGTECNITDCQTETVVVFLDRAEVTRSLSVRLTKGENEVILKNLSAFVDTDSIRIEGRGPATIAEVAFRTKYLTSGEQDDVKEEQNKIRQKLEAAKRLDEVLKQKSIRLEKQRSVLDGFADNAIKGSGITATDGTTNPSFLSKDNLVGMTAFLELFDRQAARLDDSLHSLKLEQEKNKELIRVLEQKLGDHTALTSVTEARELVILLEASESAEVTLFISYVLTNASWEPCYDIRVYSEEKQLKIQYYGVITQSTGEDWLDAKICLSTARPSVGGEVPTLSTQKLAFKSRHLSTSESSQSTKPKYLAMAKKSRHAFERRSNSFSVKSEDGESGNQEFVLAQEQVTETFEKKPELTEPKVEIIPHEVKESITTTMYEIARRTTIPSDSSEHKVTVAIIDLKPEFEYQAVPKVAAKAYLKAKVRNTSPYALLTGFSNIFLDNTFIAKSELKAASPKEEFMCSLGVDPTIRIDYKPLVKYREQSGLISKTTVVTYKQVIEVKNTHRGSISIQVVDQLPQSTEEKIKVTLLEPVIKHPEKYDPSKPIRLNSANNIEWDLQIAAGETKELVLKYSIEYPSNEQIDIYEAHSSSSYC